MKSIKSKFLCRLFTSAAYLLCASALAVSVGPVSASTTTTKTEEPGLRANLISTTGLSTANVIGGAVGGFVGGNTGLAGGIRRFALPGQETTGAAAAASGNLWNAWLAYSRSNVGFEFTPLRSDGSVNVYLGGIDYTFNNKAIFGVAFAHDKTDIDLNFNGGKLKGNGNTISPYLGVALDQNWILDATLGFGRSNVDASGGGVSGSFNVDRTLGSLGITFRNTVNNWQLSARAAYLSVHDKLGAYTLTNGTLVPDGTINLSQLRLVGQIGYNAGYVTPYFSLSYINDLRRPDQAPVGGVTPANDDDAWTPTIGLRFKTDGTVYGSLQYSTERGRSEIKNNQFLLNLGVRF